ncbi:MAG TPA: hypothetical protein VGH84_14660, partial [Steroidobacteraceae bacterium]
QLKPIQPSPGLCTSDIVVVYFGFGCTDPSLTRERFGRTLGAAARLPVRSSALESGPALAGHSIPVGSSLARIFHQ